MWFLLLFSVEGLPNDIPTKRWDIYDDLVLDDKRLLHATILLVKILTSGHLSFTNVFTSGTVNLLVFFREK